MNKTVRFYEWQRVISIKHIKLNSKGRVSAAHWFFYFDFEYFTDFRLIFESNFYEGIAFLNHFNCNLLSHKQTKLSDPSSEKNPGWLMTPSLVITGLWFMVKHYSTETLRPRCYSISLIQRHRFKSLVALSCTCCREWLPLLLWSILILDACGVCSSAHQSTVINTLMKTISLAGKHSCVVYYIVYRKEAGGKGSFDDGGDDLSSF